MPGFSGLNFDFAWGDYHHTEFENPGEAGTEFDSTAFNLGLQLQHNPLYSWDGAFGVQYANRLLSAVGDEAYIPSVQTQSVAGYLVEERDWGFLAYRFGGLAWNTRLMTRIQRSTAQFRPLHAECRR